MNIKQKIFRISMLMLATFLGWYMIIAFTEWDLNWIEYLSDATNTSRSYFVLGVAVKIVLDFWLWSYIKDKWFHRHADDDKKIQDSEQDKLRKFFN